jgi:hypothetical protein
LGQKAEAEKVSIYKERQVSGKEIIPPNPLFQHSNIPLSASLSGMSEAK